MADTKKECPDCKGVGTVNGGAGNQVNCGTCKGHKTVTIKDSGEIRPGGSNSGSWFW